MRLIITLIGMLIFVHKGVCQEMTPMRFHAGYKNYQPVDSSRVYKPNSSLTDRMHFRPISADIWFPSKEKPVASLSYGELLGAFETHALRYQDQDYKGLTNELAEQLFALSGSQQITADDLLKKRTNSFTDLQPIETESPVIIYMAGQNGASFENYPILENLAENGYVVISIWSVGRYPGNMSNSMEDMMEQVYDAEFLLKELSKNNEIGIDTMNMGIIGYSWGGMSAAVLQARHPTIKATVSLDGTETYYFGESDKEDHELRRIHDANLLHPEKQNSAYVYLESGDKINSFTPTDKYDYYEQKSGRKHYARFLNHAHEDFSCLPSLLNASPESNKRYQELMLIVRNFLNENLKADFSERELSQQVTAEKDVLNEPLEITENLHASTRIVGKVIDKQTKKPIPYVNLGIPQQKTGTVSDENGNFSFAINKAQLADTLKISCIGYDSVKISLVQLTNGKPISLTPGQEQLQEVVITGKGLKNSTIGNRAHSKFISTPFGYKQLGAEMGVKMRIKKSPTHVDAFNVNVPYNRLSGKAIFRLNFYTIKNDEPSANIVKENILIPINPGQTGVISTSLSQYNIILTEDVIVSLEWVGHDGELKHGDGINFSLGFFNHGTYVRYASQSIMEKKFGMGVGFNLEVRY